MPNQNDPPQGPPIVHDHQLNITGTIKPTRGEGEAIHFHINLCMFRLVIVVNMPRGDEDHVPVYVKFRLNDEQDRSPRAVEGRAPYVRRQQPPRETQYRRPLGRDDDGGNELPSYSVGD